jgi:carbohydrate-binding DOMON domain-containing protein
VARSRSLPLAAALLAAAPAGGLAAPRPVAAFEDAEGDATGPGGYAPPGDPEFEAGTFDLRRFEVLVDGDDVVLEVTLGARIRPPASTQRTNATPLDLSNGIYLQNVDVYVDTDRSPASGFASCIPGRRVAFADGRTWEAAVVLTPQPGPTRAIVASSMGPAARRISFPTGLQARGRTLVARVPAAALGGLPREDWGWAVHVSGARWERASTLLGSREPDAFTMPVTTVREAWAFGGAPKGELHPRVVDVLLPPGADQRAVLGSFDAASGTFARVPFVDARATVAGAAPAPAPAPPEPPGSLLRIVDVSGDVVTLSGAVEGIVPLQIGRVLGEGGATVARVVVARVVGGGLVANVVEGRERIARGARVAFDPPPAATP